MKYRRCLLYSLYNKDALLNSKEFSWIFAFLSLSKAKEQVPCTSGISYPVPGAGKPVAQPSYFPAPQCKKQGRLPKRRLFSKPFIYAPNKKILLYVSERRFYAVSFLCV